MRRSATSGCSSASSASSCRCSRSSRSAGCTDGARSRTWRWVNRISMNVLAPALIFSALVDKDFDVCDERAADRWAASASCWARGCSRGRSRAGCDEDSRTFVPPMMFNNCGNMGLPLAALAFGAAGFAPMVALFTISNLLHFTLGAWIIDHHARFGRLLRNPMVWSTIAGFAFALIASAAARVAGGRVQDGRRRADPDDAAVARRAAHRTCAGATARIGVIGGSCARSPAC